VNLSNTWLIIQLTSTNGYVLIELSDPAVVCIGLARGTTKV